MKQPFRLVHSEEELKAYEREVGYRGHEEPHIDGMMGDELPTAYPVLVRTVEAGQGDCDFYHRVVFDLNDAWGLMWAAAEAKIRTQSQG